MARDGGLAALFAARLPHIFWQRIESGGVGSGIPDLHFLAPGGIAGWIENKQTAGWTIPDIRPTQVAWLGRYARYGGRAFIAVRRKAAAGVRRAAADELRLFPASAARELRDLGIKGVSPVLYAAGGPARWGWEEIEHVLLYAADEGIYKNVV